VIVEPRFEDDQPDQESKVKLPNCWRLHVLLNVAPREAKVPS
jgi:hypothetical protein